MLRLRPLAVLLSLALGLCLLGLWRARSQTAAPRRVTNTSAEGLNLNPSLSGNGGRVAFESTEDVAGAGGGAFFRAVRADVSRTPAAFVQLAGARAPAPGISQDGSIIAFAAKDNPLGTNADGNSEIFIHNGATLRQITNTTPNDITRRATDGNFQPSLSDDGRYTAFSSNRNLTGQNSDGNFEVFVYDAAAGSFSQLTSTAGGHGSTDAKISGDGSRVAYIRDSSALPAVQRDLMLQDRAGGVTRLAADNVTNLSLTYGRAISDDGSRVVFAGDTAANASQVFLYDARTNSARALTALEARETEVPLHPTISGDGTRVAFAARRTVPQLGGNGDHSIELYTLDLPTGQFAAVTDAPSNADGFQGSTRVAEVVSSLSDDGSLVAFNFPRSLSGEVGTGLENNSEIYVSGTAARPTTGTLEVLNGASFGHEPSTEEAVAPESYAVATGGALAFETAEAERQPDGTYPTTLAGTTVTVQGRRAQIVSVSPTRVDFLVPADTPLGDATVVVTNEEGFRSTGTIEVKTGAPGIFTKSGDGTGEGEIVNAQTGASGPFDPTDGELRLLIYTTGVRRASEVTARAGGHTLTVESVTESATRPGTDEVRVRVPAELRGAGPVDLFVRADGRDSNPVTITFLGLAPRPDIVINEVLADPPTDNETTPVVEGDANRDGVRDTEDDEFVELVNASGRDLNIGGYQLFSRGTTGAEDNLRHTFAAGTIFPAGTAVVVFGGGNFNPRNAAFGGAQVFKASEGELSLVNGGGTVTLRDASARLVTNFSWGGSTGLEADENQSLTRSPDVTGAYTQHTTASGSNNRPYSPGTRAGGQPFNAPAVARIEVTPASASIAIGQTQQFTARAFDASGNEMSGVIFAWESSAPAVATVDENGLAAGKSEGTTEIRARARGTASAPATLAVRFVPRELTSIEVSPSAAAIPVGGQQQFTARGLDQFGNEMSGLTFAWESTNPSVATVDANGLATGLGIGTTTIRASAGGKTGTAALDVTAPRIVINEALADPPGSADTDLAGDANRDGVRDSSQDEFVELVNSSNAPVDISGWTIRTRTLDGATETLRHTFAAGTSVPAGSAVVVFGGGTEEFDPSDSAFGCAQVVKASSGRLSLLNSGETIVVTDANGNLTAQLTYGSDAGLNGGANQSMTRSPDVTGDFTLHTAAPDSGGRAFSPGLRVDGTPFGNCPARLTSVTIQPATQGVTVGRTTQFTAQARDQYGRPMKGVAITFVSDNTSVATIDSVKTDPATGVATATVRGRSAGTAHITARATTNGTTVTSDPATLNVTPPPPRVTRVEVTPAAASVNRGGTQKFTAKAFNGTTQVTAGVVFTWTSSDTSVATVDQNGLASGVGIGTATITATAPDGLGGTVSDTAQLTVRVPLVINEILADVPTDDAATRAVEGDANRDGVRSSGDDEFVELLNNTNAPVDVSGIIIADATSNRFTIPAGTILAAGRALVIFGGGEPPADDPNFGGALVIKIPGSLSLNDTGDTVYVKLPVGGTEVVIASESYGEAGGAPRAGDQSLTRSPDASVGTAGGALVPHATVTNADGRVFSPGTRTDGAPFGSPAITRIQVTPASATVDVGGSRTFAARAFSNASGTEVEVLNVSFVWDASDPTKAEVAPKTGQATTATALAGGSTLIRARAGGKQGAGTLNVNFPPVARIEVSPATATIPVGGAIQFTARAFDAGNNEIPGFTFTWSSSNPNVATVDGSGLATGVGTGTTTIRASAGGKSGTAALTVVARTVAINEVLADPPEGAAGDANRDGVRDSSDDEFVELVNALSTAVNVSGWTLRTRTLEGTTETVRHTFADGATLAAGKGVVVFGGGTINAADPAFGGSQVVTASTGRLSLTNGGLHVVLRDSAGNLVAQFTYGGTTGLDADKNQSLTRSPDVTGDFVLHTQAPGSDARVFSPGTRADGTPFGSPAITRIQVLPATATVNTGASRVFTARAFSNASGTEVEVLNVSFVWDSSNPNVAAVSPSTGKSTTATALSGGITTIRARAGSQAGAGTLNVNFPPVERIEVSPATATIPVGGTQQFTARAFDANNNEIPGLTFTWTSSNTGVATIDSSGVATGAGVGTTTITASARGKSGTATLNVVARTVTINEVLSDPPEGAAGDANRDGVRDSADDEFVELVNALNSSVNIAGWTLRTRSLSGTAETVRHTFGAGTTLPAGKAIVVFGGGSPNAADPAFGGAQVVTTSTSGLSLTNSGLHLVLRDSAGNLVAQFTYGGSTGLSGDKDQSLTRSPDIAGDFTLHTAAPDSDGRVFSPGTRVDGTPFGSPAITRIQIVPASATLSVGGSRVFTARAFSNASGTEVEVFNVSFVWDSSDPSKATVSPAPGRSTTATAHAGGSATIRARAGGQAGTATLTINFPPVSRIEVTPATATIPIGGTQQFTARAFDAGNNEIPGFTFTWSSSNTNVATVDQNGLATGVGTGTTTIRASAGGKSGTAALTVVARTVAINEVLADPPEGAAGDANRDGVRDSADDEFVELVNALNSPVNIAGWTIRTRSLTGSTETLRHTFADGTTLAAGKGIVVFGGGTINAADPAFGGSQVVTTSTSGLSLTNSGLHVILRDSAGNLVARLTYGGDTGLDADQNQSLTRSPDVTGDFVLHTAAANAAGRLFSPGTRTDGTPFGSPPITRIEVLPASATVNIGGKKTYTARAFSNASGTEVEVLNVSFVWDSSNPNVATVSPATGKSTTATALSGGSTTIRAQAGGQQDLAALNVNFPPVSRIEVTPAAATIPVGGTQQFTARAFDANNNEIPGLTFTWTSSDPNVATVDQKGLATGVAVGATTITASARGKSGTATLNVVARTITINEILADPPEGPEGDANRDGLRDSADDEFVELVNALNSSVNVSGWTIRTRTLTSATETLRHTFADGTTLPAGKAIVVFGGGSPPTSDPAFGGSQVVTASTGRLSVTNSGLHVIVRDASGNLVARLTYGGSSGLNADANQSLTRSPDITGDFAPHTTAVNADGRVFSPGTRTDGTPFGSPAITRIEVTPASATVTIGGKKTYIARAFSNASGTEVEVTNVSFVWDSSNPSKATVSPTTGRSTTATALAGGSTTIRARAGGQAGAGTLNISFPPVARIEVTPATATIPVGGTIQFTARAFDASDNEIPGVTFTWTSGNKSAATIDSSGVATGVGVGATTIKATAGGKNDTAALTVVARTVAINEILADPPEGLAGDANRDGVRDSADDEFVELVNALSTAVNISGWTIRTRSLSGTAETVRHTFDAGTSLPAGRAIVVFGGGSPNAADPAFGGAQVVTTSTSGLSLTNSGLHLVLRDSAGNLVAQLTYGSAAGLNGDSNQSLTRSPDITGGFALHTAATNADGRVFSPGTRVDGTPFGSPAITRIEVTPASATTSIGGTQQFTARAFSNASGTEVEVFNVSFVWDSSNPSVATVSPATGQSTTATAHAGGSATVRARAGGRSGAGTLNVNFPPIARVEVTPESESVNEGGTVQFTARAFDASDNEIPGVTFTWTSSDPSVATVDSTGLATGVGIGTATITADAGGHDDTATLNVLLPDVVINELLADPQADNAGTAEIEGDSNRDGVRDTSDDEFVELVNRTSAAVNLSGWTIRTRSLTGTSETLRHTFADGTTLPANDAIVVFGGGAFDPSDPAFGGAQVVAASTGGLSLTNTGLHVVVRDAAGEFVTEFTYGSAANLNGNADQSLTRSPDVTGDFVLHTQAAGANGRRFSPGRKADGSFFVPRTGTLTSVTISPASATVIEGQTTQFTAQAFDHYGQPMTGVTITFESSDTNVATVESVTTAPNGVATATVRGQNEGSADIKARATDGTNNVESSPASLTVTAAPPRVTSVEVSPASATVNRGGTQQFTATAFDGSTPVGGVTFTWTSSDTNVATVDQNGLATGVGIGTATITATAPDGTGGTASDTATLNVQVPLVINEILADPPAGIAGDSNRDGTTNTDDDEFVELVNNSNAPVDVSGVVLSDATSNRFTFPAGTTLAANQAAVIFGGGSPNASDANFGGALIFTTSSLGLNNAGDTVTLKLAVGGTDAVVATETYGSNAGNDQSLTRSPDLTGAFEHHTTATNSNGRRFSPGTRLDGTPFGSPAITRIEVTPASATIYEGGSQPFTARAFSNAGGPEVEVLNVSFYWTSSNTAAATVAPLTGQSTTATGVAAGTATISALAGGQAGTAALTVNAVVASIELAPPTATVAAGSSQTFTATARDSGGNVITGLTFSFSLRDASPPTAATITGTTADTVTVRGDQVGTVTVVVNYTRPNDGATLEDTSQLDIAAAPTPVDHVEVSPASATINRGQTQQFTATAFDSSNQPLAGVTFTWTSSDESVATVDANGLATGHDSGTVTITASTPDGTGGTASDTATLTVQIPVLIGEFRTQGQAGANDEFVEIYNPSTDDVLIGGLKLRGSNSAGTTSTRATIPAGTTLGPGCHYLFANNNATTGYSGPVPPDQTYGTGFTNDGGLAITRPNDAVIDAVGMSAGSAYGEGTRLPAFPSSNPTNRSYERRPGGASGNGQDTNDNAADFITAPGHLSNPQNSSSGCVNTGTADLSVTKADSPDPVVTGEDVTYTITVTNNGPGVAQSVVVTDNLPGNVTFVSCNSTGGGVCGGTGNNRTVTFSSLAVGASATVTLVATADGAGGTTITNTASVSSATPDPNDANDSDTETTTVQLTADLELFIQTGDGSPNVGDEASFTVQLNNDGPFDATGVTVKVTLAAGLEYVSHSPSQTYDPNTGVWDVGTVTAGGTRFLTITTKILTGGNKESSAEVTSSDQFDPDSTPNNNNEFEDDYAFIIFFVKHSDLSLTKSVDNATPTVGDNVVFTVSLNNVGNVATGVQVTDQLPAGLAYVSSTATHGSYDSGTGVWAVGSVASSATATLTITATVTAAGSYTNTAEVTASEVFDPDSTPNNHNAAEDDQDSVTVTTAAPQVTRVEVSPATATINRGRTQQFTATAFDASNNPVPGLTFTWTSSNTNVATVDANGLATGVGIGTTTITAETSDGAGGTISDTASLTVQVPLVINEILADPPAGIAGDANRDGTGSTTADEFIELVNNSNAPVNVSGVVVSDSTSNRFTFPANTTLAANQAAVIFGGGTPPANNPNFGGSLIFTTSGLGLNNDTDTVTVKLPVGGSDVVIATHTYNTTNPDARADQDQSLTRSPDVTGAFIKHTIPADANNRRFSPGTRLDGTPFGSPAITRIEVTPATAAIDVGDTQQFTAKAFSNAGGPEVEIPNVSFIWESSTPTVATVSPTQDVSTTATAVAPGSTNIIAQAGGQSGTAALTVNAPPPSLSINDVSATEGDAGTKSFVFTVSLSDPAPAGGVTFDISTADNTATDADNDYEPNSATAVNIPATQTSTTFTVLVNGDLAIESTETFFVDVTNVTGATVADGQGLGTIQNDDSPTLSVDDATVTTEGNAGTKTYTFTVRLSQPAPAGGVTFDIATADNTAKVDDGNPATVSDNDYVGKSLTAQTIPETAQEYQFTVTVNGDTVVEPDETFFVNVTNVTGATVSDPQALGTIQNDDTPDLVISQIYPGGGNAGATYTNDFIEIFNQGTTTIDFSVTNYSVQYAGAAASFGSTAATNKTNIITGTIAPGQYFLIQGASGGANGVALPTPDLVGSIGMSAAAGKVALVLGIAALPANSCPGDDLSTAPTNPSGNNIVDFVGYGSGTTTNAPNCYEGSGFAVFSLSTAGGLDPDARSVIRTPSCTDSDNNSTDFTNPTTAPTARNKSTPPAPCP